MAGTGTTPACEKRYTLSILGAGLLFLLFLFFLWRNEIHQIVWTSSASQSDVHQGGLSFWSGLLVLAFMALLTSLWTLDVPRYGKIYIAAAVFYCTVITSPPPVTVSIILIGGLFKTLCYATAGIIRSSIDSRRHKGGIRETLFSMVSQAGEPLQSLRETIYFLISFGIGSLIYGKLIKYPPNPPGDTSHTSLSILAIVLCLLILLWRVRSIYRTLAEKKSLPAFAAEMFCLLAAIYTAGYLLKSLRQESLEIAAFAPGILLDVRTYMPPLCAILIFLLIHLLISAEKLSVNGIKPKTRELFFSLISFCAVGIIYMLSVRERVALPGRDINSVIALFAIVLSTLIVFLIMHFFSVLEKSIAAQIKISPEYFRRVNIKMLKVHLSMYMPLGLLIATIFTIEPRGLVLLVPVYIMYKSLKSYSEIHREALATIEELAIAFESRDPFTRSHSQNVAQIAGEIAKEMHLDDEEIEKIISAGKLHDLGKIGISDEILGKGKFESLSFEEHEEIRKHPERGREITQSLSWYKDEGDYIYYHHEWFDGSGYPEGKRGREIPLGSRILMVAEAFDYMAFQGSYRDPVPLEIIVDELKKKRGTQFDPEVIDALLKIIKDKSHRNGTTTASV